MSSSKENTVKHGLYHVYQWRGPGWPLRNPDLINDDGNDGDDVDNDDDYDNDFDCDDICSNYF